MTTKNMRRESAEINLSRRSFLAAATASACVAAPVAIAATNPDAELLALFAEYRRLTARANVGDLTDEECNAICDLRLPIIEQIKATPAKTPQGIGVKLRVFFAEELAFSRNAELLGIPDEDDNESAQYIYALALEAERIAA